MLIEIRGGLDVRVSGAPEQAIHAGREPDRVALVGLDYPGLRANVEVEFGQIVALGETLASDRACPLVRYPAPGAGQVVEINRGPKRSLVSIVIELDGGEREAPIALPAGTLQRLSREQVCDVLLSSGWWPALRRRPYGKVPSPDGVPEALLVTAIDTEPLAPDPQIILAERADDFAAGMTVLSRLARRTFLCCAPNADLPDSQEESVTVVRIAGRHPAGLVGTHIHYLCAGLREVWHIGYQDVLAIGRLFATGSFCTERVVALAGPAAQRARLVRTRLGADLSALVGGEMAEDARLVSGSVLSGRAVTPTSGYLGRFHHQVCLLPAVSDGAHAGWFRRAARQLCRPRQMGAGVSSAGWTGGMLPVEAFDRVWPFSCPPAPLLRALLAGDTETAQRLGCDAFVEEDMALCSYVCPAKLDYGSALRVVLDQIERGR